MAIIQNIQKFNTDFLDIGKMRRHTQGGFTRTAKKVRLTFIVVYRRHLTIGKLKKLTTFVVYG